MNTKTRPIYIIERDIRETMDKAAKAVRQGRYMDAAILAERADNLKEELSYAMELVKFDEDNRNMDKSLRSWFGKILSLSLNEADMALYHIDMFFAYMQDRGYVPVPEWERKRRELRKAVIGYRNFVRHFLRTTTISSTMRLTLCTYSIPSGTRCLRIGKRFITTSMRLKQEKNNERLENRRTKAARKGARSQLGYPLRVCGSQVSENDR